MNREIIVVKGQYENACLPNKTANDVHSKILPSKRVNVVLRSPRTGGFITATVEVGQ